MKNSIKKIISSGIILSSVLLSSIVTISSKQNYGRTNAEEFPQYSFDSFVTCENWHESGKGFALDFTFDPTTIDGSGEVKTTMQLLDNKGNQIAKNSGLYFKSNGDCRSDIGKVIKRGDFYTYFVMFSEFDVIDGKTGKETFANINFKWVHAVVNKVYARLIDTKIYLEPEAYIRSESSDSVNGLMFKAYMPSLVSGSKYGMAIVPNEYLSNLTSDFTTSFKSNKISYLETYCEPIELKSSDDLYAKYGSGYYIKASMGNIKNTNYMRDFTALPFEETSNGARKYAFNIDEVKDNLYNASYRAVKANNLPNSAKTYAENIVNNINNRITNMSTSNITAYPANNTDQIMKNADYTSTDTSVSFKAARGESEGAQLVLKTASSSTKKIYAAVSNLYNGNNVIENSNIEVDYELYQNVATNWSLESEHTSSQNQLYDICGVENLATGYYPDALMPMHVAVRSGNNNISNDNGSNQALYIKVNVPGNAVTGTYTGKVIIYVVGEGLLTVPVSLIVNNFSIEGRNDANTIFPSSRSELQDLYGSSRARYNTLDNEFYSSSIKFLKERGVSGGVIPKSCDVLDSLPDYVEAVKDFVRNSKTKSYFINFNQEDVSMTYTYAGNKTIAYDRQVIASDTHYGTDYGDRCGLKDILMALVNASTNELNLLKGCCVYDPHADEPSSNTDYLRNILNYNSVRTSIEYVLDNADFTGKANVQNSLEKVTYIVTCGPEDGKFVGNSGIQNMLSISDVSSGAQYCSCSTAEDIQYRNLDTYCPNVMWNCDNSEHSGSGYSWETLSKVYDGTDTTTRVWEYTCIQPVAPYPSYLINAPMIRSRANRWRHFRIGVQGEFYYLANRVYRHPSTGSDVLLTEEQILNGDATFQDAYGDGLLMYPVHDTYGYADRNLYWFSSLRLENISEANDDLNYLYYAKELIGNNSSNINSLNAIIDSVYGDKHKPYTMTTSNSTIVTARNNLISLINSLL